MLATGELVISLMLHLNKESLSFCLSLIPIEVDGRNFPVKERLEITFS
jgi:hypothetical protein